MGKKSAMKTQARVIVGTALIDGVSRRRLYGQVLQNEAFAKFGHLEPSIKTAKARDELAEILYALYGEYDRSPGEDCARIARQLYEFITQNGLS
jgi:hypothetical protein